MDRRQVLASAAALAFATATGAAAQGRGKKPNVIVILCDDMGYGDLSLHGAPSINTPNIDRLAHEGIEFTSFYTAPVCTPTRGMLLTSRYPARTGLYNPTGPKSPDGIRNGEITIADLMKKQGYRTAMFGKWHLGDFESNPDFNPVKHGFDRFLGQPYSHDYNPPEGVPLFDGLNLVQRPVDIHTITKRLTEGAVDFIEKSGKEPFFIYLAHPMPHIPVAASPAFQGHSRAGPYGDTIEELDWSVGEILRTLKSRGLDQDTLVMFLSDNGPWNMVGERQFDRGERGVKQRGEVGSAGQMRGSKTSVWEGGVRLPLLARWPGRIQPGQRISDIVSVMDIYPTILGFAGGSPPTDRTIDGMNVAATLTKGAPSPRREVFFFLNRNLLAVREGPWKLQMPDATKAATGGAELPKDPVSLEPQLIAAQTPPSEPALFNVMVDPGERFNRAAEHPDIVQRLTARLATAQAAFTADQALPQPAA